MATHSSILAWRIPRMEEPGYGRWGHKELDMTEATWQTRMQKSLKKRQRERERNSLFALRQTGAAAGNQNLD